MVGEEGLIPQNWRTISLVMHGSYVITSFLICLCLCHCHGFINGHTVVNNIAQNDRHQMLHFLNAELSFTKHFGEMLLQMIFA